MEGSMIDFLLYFLNLVVSTLGVFFACGLAVHLISWLFSKLMGSGSGAMFDITSVIGTPVHELGHAAMCVIFRHDITRIRLWTPKPEDGVYGFVEHSYSKKNPWARFGNLFIGMGPLFSGLGVTVLLLWLCFPTLWGEYLQRSAELIAAESLSVGDVFANVSVLLRGIPSAFADDWLRCLFGLLIILPISLHISMSPQDVRSCIGTLPFVLFLLLIVAFATFWTPARDPILSGLWLFDVRLLALFALVIGFALVWLALAALVRFVKVMITWF